MNFAHSLKQKEYFFMKYEILKELLGTTPRERAWSDKRTGKTYREIRVQSRTSPFYTELYHLWYKNGKRTLNFEEVSKLDWLGLAIWFMDDGFKGTSGGSYISFYVYTDEEKEKMIAFLNEKFNLNARLHGNNKIYIPCKQGKIFKENIKQFMPKSMLYKIA